MYLLFGRPARGRFGEGRCLESENLVKIMTSNEYFDVFDKDGEGQSYFIQWILLGFYIL